MVQRKLDRWRDAGLIDAETVARIIKYERENARPLALWAVIGLGGLAIGLGLISVVAANWDAISGVVRLALHFLLLSLNAALLFWMDRRRDQGHRFFDDAALFIFGLLGLTFFGHLGQVYQTGSPLWQPLLVWLSLFSPILLLRGRGWLIALSWMVAVIATLLTYADWYQSGFGNHMPPIQKALLYAIPSFIVPVAAFMRSTGREEFWRRLEQAALVASVAGSALLQVEAQLSYRPESVGGYHVETASLTILFFGISAAAAFLARRGNSGRAVAIILAGIGFANLLAALNGGKNDIFAALIFMAQWALIATCALSANWRGVFQLSVAVISIRLIILNMELTEDLLGSGLGMILTGAVAIAIAWIAVRIGRAFAPEKRKQPLEGDM